MALAGQNPHIFRFFDIFWVCLGGQLFWGPSQPSLGDLQLFFCFFLDVWDVSKHVFRGYPSHLHFYMSTQSQVATDVCFSSRFLPSTPSHAMADVCCWLSHMIFCITGECRSCFYCLFWFWSALPISIQGDRLSWRAIRFQKETLHSLLPTPKLDVWCFLRIFVFWCTRMLKATIQSLRAAVDT